jgi:uncharacterized membrane protein YeaQ/YmgE (transglycosylase-associated protein family)
MGLFSWIVVGLIAGWLAQRVTGFERRGCLFTLVLGVLGGVLGGALFNAAGGHGIRHFGWWALFVAFIGAAALCLLLGITGAPRRRRTRRYYR